MDIVKRQPLAGWEWTPQREMAASMLALDQTTDIEIAAQVGVDRNTLYLWKGMSAFAERVSYLGGIAQEAIMQEGIAVKANRVRHLNERHQKLSQVIAERAAYFASHEDPEVRDYPGVTTGLMMRQTRMVGTGRTAREVVDYVVDSLLLRELRSIEEHTARELGQWTDKSEIQIAQKTLINIDLDRM